MFAPELKPPAPFGRERRPRRSGPVALPDFGLVGAFDFGVFAKLGVLGACVWVFGLYFIAPLLRKSLGV